MRVRLLACVRDCVRVRLLACVSVCLRASPADCVRAVSRACRLLACVSSVARLFVCVPVSLLRARLLVRDRLLPCVLAGCLPVRLLE